MAQTKRVDLTQGSVTGHLWRLWWPMIAAVFAMMTVQLVDSYFVAQLGTTKLAALGFATRVMFVVMALAIGLGAGAVAVTARAAGRGSDEELRDLATASTLLALLIVGPVSLIGAVFSGPLFRAIGAPEELIPDIVAYMQVWFGGLALFVMPLVATNILRAVGDSIVPAILMISSAVLNAVFDPIFIFGWGPIPELGIAGAAWATLASRVIMFVGAMWLLVKVRGLISFTPPPWARMRAAWSEVLRVGAPAVLSNMINPAGQTIATSAMATAGVAAVAGFSSIALVIETFSLVPLFALSAAIGPVTGQNFGAGKTDRAIRAFHVAFLASIACAVLTAIVFWASGDWIVAQFNRENDPEVARFALGYLHLVPITTAGFGIMMAMSAGLNAIGRPIPGVIVTSVRSLLLYAPGVWIGLKLGGPLGAFIAIAVANIFAGVMSTAWIELRLRMRSVAVPQPASA